MEPTFDLSCTEQELVDLLRGINLLRHRQGVTADEQALGELEKKVRIGMYTVGLEEVAA